MSGTWYDEFGEARDLVRTGEKLSKRGDVGRRLEFESLEFRELGEAGEGFIGEDGIEELKTSELGEKVERKIERVAREGIRITTDRVESRAGVALRNAQMFELRGLYGFEYRTEAVVFEAGVDLQHESRQAPESTEEGGEVASIVVTSS